MRVKMKVLDPFYLSDVVVEAINVEATDDDFEVMGADGSFLVIEYGITLVKNGNKLSRDVAKQAVQTAFETGVLDMSKYVARLVEVVDEEEEG